MLGYVIALIAVGLLAVLLKVRVKAKTALLAFITFMVASFIWGTAAKSFNLEPTDLPSMILYSLVAFILFWVLWLKFGKAEAG